MNIPPGDPRQLFVALQRLTEALRQRLGVDEATACLRLVQELVARLPHKYLLSASREEIQSAGRSMLNEGRSRDEMRTVQSALVALLDYAERLGAVPSNPLRQTEPRHRNQGAAPETALVVSLRPDAGVQVEEILAAHGVLAHAEGSFREAMDHIGWFPYAFLVVGFPIRSVPPLTFMETVRGPRSLCRSAGLILVVPEREVDAALRFLGRGANRVTTTAQLAERLPDMLTVLGMVSERVRARVKVHVDLDDGQRSEIWLSENISISGMLVRTAADEAKGAELDLEFKVPGDDLPIHARAEVVRTTTFGRESFSGLGLRFLSFVGEGQHRLELFLHSRNRTAWAQ